MTNWVLLGIATLVSKPRITINKKQFQQLYKANTVSFSGYSSMLGRFLRRLCLHFLQPRQSAGRLLSLKPKMFRLKVVKHLLWHKITSAWRKNSRQTRWITRFQEVLPLQRKHNLKKIKPAHVRLRKKKLHMCDYQK